MCSHKGSPSLKLPACAWHHTSKRNILCSSEHDVTKELIQRCSQSLFEKVQHPQYLMGFLAQVHLKWEEHWEGIGNHKSLVEALLKLRKELSAWKRVSTQNVTYSFSPEMLSDPMGYSSYLYPSSLPLLLTTRSSTSYALSRALFGLISYLRTYKTTSSLITRDCLIDAASQNIAFLVY